MTEDRVSKGTCKVRGKTTGVDDKDIKARIDSCCGETHSLSDILNFHVDVQEVFKL